jgi:ApeA-like protein
MSSNGKAITLYTCSELNYRSGSRGFPTSIIRADVAFIGCHFEKPEDLMFRRLYIRPLYLEEWSGKSGIERKATKLWTIKY